MKICESICKKYARYDDFLAEIIRDAMEYEAVSLIVNWQDALGVCQILNQYTINGNSIAMCGEFAEGAYEDIQVQKEIDGNMLITIFANGELICEKALDNSDAYADGLYYVEFSAEEVNLPLHAKVIPFLIENDIFENAF